jgi:hypothetical protein
MNACDASPAVAPPASSQLAPSPSAEVLGQPAVPSGQKPALSASTAKRWTFDDVAKSSLPTGFNVATGRWEVTEQRALRQLAQSPTSDLNVVLATGARTKDFSLRVRMRAVEGKTDRGGGVIWRARDARNYYVARYNPREKNFRAYSVVGGVSKELASATVELDGHAWHTLETRVAADRIEGSIDGKRYLELYDRSLEGAGMIGLWTKGDAITDFDDLALTELR